MLRSDSSQHSDVVIVDANKRLTDMLGRFLSLKGYKVTISNTLSDSISISDKMPSVVLLDPVFNEHSKEEVLSMFQNKGLLQNHKVIIFSGACDNDFINQWRSRGVQSHLQKPITTKDLMRFLEEGVNVKRKYHPRENEGSRTPQKSGVGIFSINKSESESIPPEKIATPRDSLPKGMEHTRSSEIKQKTTPETSKQQVGNSNNIIKEISVQEQSKELIKTLNTKTSTNKLDKIITDLSRTKEHITQNNQNSVILREIKTEKLQLQEELNSILKEIAIIQNEIHDEIKQGHNNDKKSNMKFKTTKSKRVG